MIPLRPLPEFIAHEQELLAGMAEHKPVQQPEIREFLPFVAGHFAQHGAFAVDDFIVRQGQNEIFARRHRPG